MRGDIASVQISLKALAERFDLQLQLPADSTLSSASLAHGVNTLKSANAEQIAFLANPKYAAQLASTNALAVIVNAAQAVDCQVAALISSNPYADFARVAALFERNVQPLGIATSAQIEAGAQIDPTAAIGALCVVASSAKIGARAVLHAGCIIGPDCVIGADCELHSRVTLVKRVRLGDRVILHSGAVLGADGFGLAPISTGWLKIPQLGGVQIGDDCEIGANTTIDCGALEDTILGIGVKLDNQIQVGHNVMIGDYTAIAGCTAIAGSSHIGKRCLIAGGVGIAGHLNITDGVRINAMTLVANDILEPGDYSGAMPIMPTREWRKNAVHIRRLDERLRARKFD